MSYIAEINQHCLPLPDEAQKQVLDFICFLESRLAQQDLTETNKDKVIFGVMAGEFNVPDNFDDALPDDLLATFYDGKL